MPELIACPSCHSQISNRASKCPKCGNSREAQCLVCKKHIMMDSIGCPECGDPYPFGEQIVSHQKAEKNETNFNAITIPNFDIEEREKKPAPKTAQRVSGRKYRGSKQWSIYTKGGKILAVKNGFCWPAFFFTFGWAIFNSLWLIAISYFVFVNSMEIILYNSIGLMNFQFDTVKFDTVQFGVIQFDTFYVIVIILELLFRFSFGYSANRLVTSSLVKKGFWKGITISAKNKQSAIEQYIR